MRQESKRSVASRPALFRALEVNRRKDGVVEARRSAEITDWN
jgi:hypothetical protein